MSRTALTGKLVILALLAGIAGAAGAQSMTQSQLVTALQKGGMVVVMRHASSPRERPDAASAAPGNTNLERQLDARGRREAIAFGEALKRLGIEFSRVGTSPAFRARQTANLAGLRVLLVHDELGNEDMRDAGADRAAWLRRQTATVPEAANELLITHGPNISAAFPDVGRTAEGEALVFNPALNNRVPIGRIAIDAWPDL